MLIENARLQSAEYDPSPNFNDRPGGEISLIVVHNISLPAGHFGNGYIKKLFCNQLENVHPDFEDLLELRVSPHLLIGRTGKVTQFVPFDRRAWHAGESSYMDRSDCNDFSVGIELEGTDTFPYRNEQYTALIRICRLLMAEYDIGYQSIVGHSDIAPGRKTDPGPVFEWFQLKHLLKNDPRKV